MNLIGFMTYQWMTETGGEGLWAGGSVCHPAGQGRIKYATTVPIRHLPNLCFHAWALDFLQLCNASQHISLLAARNFFLVPKFHLWFKPITESTKKERLISSFVAVSLLTGFLSRLNDRILSAFLLLAMFHTAAVMHFLLLWALHIRVRVCVCLMQLRWQSWPSAGQPDPTGGGRECAQGPDSYICLYRS